MNKSVFIHIALCGLLFAGCVKESDLSKTKSETANAEDFFDFATTKTVALNVKYDVATDYKVLFSVYDQNPYTMESGKAELNVGLEPIVKGFTDAGGAYNHLVVISSDVERVYIYSYYVGVPNLLVADVENGTITADSTNMADVNDLLESPSTRAISNAAGLLYYTTWNKNGRIDSRYRTNVGTLSTWMLNLINRTIAENGDNSKYALTSDYYVSKDTKITIRFVDGETSAKSILGYYCYKGTEAPDNVSDLKRIVIFPNANKNSKGVYSNDAVQLKYYDENTKTYSDVFPAGYSIGWFDVNNGGSSISSGKLTTGNATYYSTTKYNGDNRSHVASFDMDNNGEVLRVLSLEDWNDKDYNDVMFSIHTSVENSLGSVPVVQPSKDELIVSMSYKGVLAYEDLWPAMGDFDLNDVVVRYESQIFIGEKDNKVIRTEDKFIVLWTGGSIPCSFGYEINVLPTNVTTELENTSYTFSEQGLDKTTQKAVIMLATNISESLAGNTVTTNFKVKNTFKERVSVDELGAAPYNPFIVVNGCGEEKRKEVHLVDHAPTSKADMTLLGAEDNKDYSIPSKGIYYRTECNYPFAIQMPNVDDLGSFLNKKYEARSISETFPKFDSWVESKGASNADWYKYPVAE